MSGSVSSEKVPAPEVEQVAWKDLPFAEKVVSVLLFPFILAWELLKFVWGLIKFIGAFFIW